ncbi:MAG: methyltransferase domain-containing protein [Candidatus Omnitrophica bacterium]|nr:methyltransferase domain-containing protein [Candidatus Omnitrophota bacterium]
MISNNTSLDKKIRQAFSASSARYEGLTKFHQEIGSGILSTLKSFSAPSSVLDIGMGTGWLTEQLGRTFPQAQVIGLDFADGMIQSARRHKKGFAMVQAQAQELPFKQSCFDLITSNLAYQWVGNLAQAFKENERVLKPGGKMVVTMFGHQTFKELFFSFEEMFDGRKGCSFTRLATDKDVYQALLTAGFKDVKMRAEEKKLYFPNMMALLKWIKDIGANALDRNFYVGKDLLKRVGDYYDSRFKSVDGIYATLEVIWTEAEK